MSQNDMEKLERVGKITPELSEDSNIYEILEKIAEALEEPIEDVYNRYMEIQKTFV